MFKIFIEIATAAPAALSIISSTVKAFEAATTVEDKLKAILAGLEGVAEEIRQLI